MGDRLVLTSRRAESAVYHKRAVRYALCCVAPEGKGAFSPLYVSRQLIKLEKGKHVAEGILVAGIVRC